MDIGTGGTVVLVHTIGKVASYSVYQAAKKYCEGARVFHTHSLDPARVAQLTDKMKASGRVLTGHIQDSLDAIPLLGEQSINFKVITLVRDPFARSVSAFFENLEMFGLDKNRLPPVATACARFEKAYPTDSLDTWFDHEFNGVFSVDLLQHPFPRRPGWYCFEKANFDFLVMKAEVPDNVKEAVVGAYLGRPELRIGQENVMSDKFNAEYYAEFKAHLAQSTDRSRWYDSDYVRLFYGQGEIDRFQSGATTRPAGH